MYKVKNRYSFLAYFQLAYFLIKTKLIDRKARLFRFPIVIRGRKYIDFGERLTTGVGCRFDCFPKLEDLKPVIRFGKDVQINDYVHIVGMESITIGNNVLMASHIFISDNSHGSYLGDCNDTDPRISPIHRKYKTSPVVIGANVWIGEGVYIGPGVTIGEGCIIGAHSVVLKDVPPYSVAVGSPAKVIKVYNFDTSRWVKL